MNGIHELKTLLYSRGTGKLRCGQHLLQLTPTQLAPVLYTFDDLIIECWFSGKPCNAWDFSRKYFRSSFTQCIDPVYGACCAFNDDPALNYITHRAGMNYRLKLIAAIQVFWSLRSHSLQQNDKLGNGLFLPTTRLAGLRITINNKVREDGGKVLG